MQNEGFRAVEFVPGEPAKLEVFAGERAERPISRRLFGKFTEHLGRNIYHGMWAQVLVNPGFEPERYFVWEGHTPRGVLEHAWERGGLTREQVAPLVETLEEGLRRGVAFGWAPHGRGDVTHALDPDRVDGETAQRIEVRSLQTAEVGAAQPIFLPLHRTRDYELTLYAKASAGEGHPQGVPLRVTVRRADGERIVAEGTLGPVTGDWAKYSLRLTVDAEGVGRGEPLLLTLGRETPGTLWLDHCVLFPADHVSGFDLDVVRLCREARLPLLRYPGGNFVSGYHWEEGIGPVESRPIRRNPAWPNVPEYNHVGTDEFLAFCAAVGCEPMICVNAGSGTPAEGARWVQYCNGGPATPEGRRRAANGHPEPYGVRIWEIGNELWGDWQIGHCRREEYAARYWRFYCAMKAADPSIEVIACGQDETWNAPLIQCDAEILRSLSIHTLIADTVPRETPPEAVFRSVMAFPTWYEGHLSDLARQMEQGMEVDREEGDGAGPARIAITELQIMTRARPNNQTVAEALYLAGILNTSIRLGELVELITHSALVNHGGGLRKAREFVWENPVHLAHRLYATQSGRWPVRLRITSPTFSVRALHDLPAVENAPYLDAVALLNDDGDELTLLVTNRHPAETLAAEIVLDGWSPRPEVTFRTLIGASYLAENRFEEPEAVRVVEERAALPGSGLTYAFPPHSLTALVLQ